MAGDLRQTPTRPEDDTSPLNGGEQEAVSLPGTGAPVQGQRDHAILDDAALVERAKIEPEAFGVLYERHVRAVFAFAYSKIRDGTAAEDITSQTFLQALRALPRYQQRGVPFRSWLFRITVNLIADRHRAAHPELSLGTLGREGDGDRDGEQIDLPDPQAESAIMAWEHADQFARLIADLTPEQRTVVQLRFVEDLPTAAIAAQMARSEGAVKMLLMRALQNLRRNLDLERADAG